MPGLLLIAHAPLATALRAVAQHTYPDCTRQLSVLDVLPDQSCEDVEAAARAVMATRPEDEWLLLTDVPGATPHNAALRLLDPAGKVRVVSGLSGPMLWRSLCYGSMPVAQLAERAAEGGRRAIEIFTHTETPKTS
ncbi:MAG: PTS fructose transporter subunit IIA [Paucibacter sp.]|nr:PTS fructose transporter subunit IIA [Roseateles sp.]